jgi:hypothetical protein
MLNGMISYHNAVMPIQHHSIMRIIIQRGLLCCSFNSNGQSRASNRRTSNSTNPALFYFRADEGIPAAEKEMASVNLKNLTTRKIGKSCVQTHYTTIDNCAMLVTLKSK